MKVKSFILPIILASIVIIHSIIPFRINIINLFKNPLSFFSSIKLGIQSYNSLVKENNKLEEENTALFKNQIALEELKRENQEFKKIFDFKQASSLKLKAARIIGRDISGFLTTITIDKGSRAGVRKGMPVIDNIGLVGRVAEAAPDTSQVVLITDSSLSVSAIVQMTRASGIVSGGIGGYLVMKYISDDSVTSGDKIITSSLSQIYPSGILIGEVISVQKDLFNKETFIIIRPASKLDKIETVLVIIG